MFVDMERTAVIKGAPYAGARIKVNRDKPDFKINVTDKAGKFGSAGATYVYAPVKEDNDVFVCELRGFVAPKLKE